MSALYYTVTGTGEPLILLHSGGMNHAEWRPQQAFFARHFRVICPDHVGHGRSPMIHERLRVRDIAQEVIALMDQLGIETTHVVGSSLGGAVALWLAVHYPERLRRLVLYRVSYRKDSHSFAASLQMADPDYWRKLGLDTWLAAIHAPQGGTEAWKMVIRRVMEALDPTDSDHAHDRATLQRIRIPTLLVVGDRDPVVPLSQVLEMYETIPDASLWVLPHASHVTATNTWRAECFNSEIERFLRRRLSPLIS